MHKIHQSSLNSLFFLFDEVNPSFRHPDLERNWVSLDEKFKIRNFQIAIRRFHTRGCSVSSDIDTDSRLGAGIILLGFD